ncbi:MAG: hypothetical protein WC464_03595 [Bdellovibrionales bacterium]
MVVSSATRFLPEKGQPARLLALALLFLAPLAFGFLAIGLGQDANWDLRNYHFYNAYAFLNDRYAMDLLPSQTPYFYNPLMDVPFFVLATSVPAKVAGFALGFVQGLNFILLFIMAHAVLVVPKPLHKVVVCAALSALGMLGGGGIAQIGTTFGDNMTSLGVFLSAALVLRYIENLSTDAVAKAFRYALIFGLPVGLMTGLKLPAAIYAVGLCGGLLFVGKDLRRGFALSFAFGLGALIGCAVTLGPWAVFLQAHFGSPLFPYFNDFFGSPLAPPTSARDMQYAPHSWSDYFLIPFIFAKTAYRVGEIELRDWRIPILYVLLPAAFVLRLLLNRRSADRRDFTAPDKAKYLLIGFALAYVAWLVMFSIYRYAVTLEMMTPLLILLAVGLLPIGVKKRAVIAACLLVVVALSVQPGNWTRREAWLDLFVEAQVPDLGDTSNLMILMAGMEPYSHVIPEFPPEISFVRIQSNFSSPEEDKGINKLLHERVDAHRKKGGRFMMLVPLWQVSAAEDAAAYFGLKVASKECKQVTDKLFNDSPLSLCPVVSQ